MGPARFNAMYASPGFNAPPKRLNMKNALGLLRIKPGIKTEDMSDPISKIAINTIVDMETIVPGDWVYFENINYTKVYANQREYRAVIAKLPKDTFASGENAVYEGNYAAGQERFSGLGVARKSALETRNSIATAFNREVANAKTSLGSDYRNVHLSIDPEDQRDLERNIPFKILAYPNQPYP